MRVPKMPTHRTGNICRIHLSDVLDRLIASQDQHRRDAYLDNMILPSFDIQFAQLKSFIQPLPMLSRPLPPYPVPSKSSVHPRRAYSESSLDYPCIKHFPYCSQPNSSRVAENAVYIIIYMFLYFSFPVRSRPDKVILPFYPSTKGYCLVLDDSANLQERPYAS